tara:strand:+ start:936 stop:1313 length:378 start_codon:yes stop_codon:yes gene_type:complete
MEQEEYLEDQRNRLERDVSNIIALDDADDRMLAVTEILTETEVVPDVGRYYTFIYAPKTPRIRYDQFPLIACVGLFQWGFRGYNFHWPAFRNYTWEEVVGYLHTAYPLEMNDLRSIPYQNFQINN